MKHKRLATVVSAVLFAGILLISFRLIFTVSKVEVNYAACTETTENEILSAKENLTGFLGKNVFSVDESEVEAYLSGNPYFRVVEVKVRLPHGLTVTVEERLESFAVFNGGKYYFLDSKSYVLSEKDNNGSRADGKGLAVFTGDVPEFIVGKTYDGQDGLFNAALKCLNVFEDARNELSEIELSRYDETGRHERLRLTVKTKEGAIFSIWEADMLSDKKAQLLKNVFYSLKGEDRVNAYVKIFTGENNTVDYE